jgi:hypothetical protein
LNSSVRYEVGHFCLEAALSALLAINASTETVGGANYYLRLQAELCIDCWAIMTAGIF